MASIHTVKIIPGTKEESLLYSALQNVGVNPERVMCRKGSVFNTRYDEYLLSGGLYSQIADVIEHLRGQG